MRLKECIRVSVTLEDEIVIGNPFNIIVTLENRCEQDIELLVAPSLISTKNPAKSLRLSPKFVSLPVSIKNSIFWRVIATSDKYLAGKYTVNVDLVRVDENKYATIFNKAVLNELLASSKFEYASVSDVLFLFDTDKDGIPDNIDVDDDNDGLTDDQEIQIGTDPTNVDTDGDGVVDSKDDFPLDSTEQYDSDRDGIGDNNDEDDDNDGLDDILEIRIGTDPYKKDTDNDGLSDYVEYVIGTDPTDPDTDNDGINDYEDAFPKDPMYSRDDNYNNIPDKIEKDYKKNQADHGEREKTGEDVLENAYQDTDNDGLTDVTERYVTKTDPHSAADRIDLDVLQDQDLGKIKLKYIPEVNNARSMWKYRGGGLVALIIFAILLFKLLRKIAGVNSKT